jgi:hypothetical protein
MKSEAGPPPCTRFSLFSQDTRVKVTIVARPLLMPVAQKLNGLQKAGTSSFRRRRRREKTKKKVY